MSISRALSWLIAALMTFSVAIAQNDETSKIVDFEAEVMRPIKIGDSTVLNLLGSVVFYHNGAIITCDSAIRYNDKRMECFRNVIVNKQDVYAYGDRADYNGELNLARIYAPIVKMVDKDATLYTYDFSFNTLDNIGKYGGGGTMEQKDNLLESERGYYYADTREVVCVNRVEVKNPDYKIKSDSVSYNMDTEVATFLAKTYIWNSKGEILSANRGFYDTKQSKYFFTSDAYILTEKQEVWADTIDYKSDVEDAVLRRNIQLRDEEQKVIAFGDYGQYWGKPQNAMLTLDPSLVSFDPEQDTLYMRSDSMFLYSVDRETALMEDSLRKESAQKHIEGEELIDDGDALISGDSTQSAEVDPLVEDRAGREHEGHNHAEQKTDSIAERELTDVIEQVVSQPTEIELEEEVDTDGQELLTKEQKSKLKAEKKRVAKAAKDFKRGKNLEQESNDRKDNSSVSGPITMQVPSDSVASLPVGEITEKITVGERVGDKTRVELLVGADSSAILSQDRADSLSHEANALLKSDTTAANQPDSLVRILRAYNNVKIFRTDFQAVCDSLLGFSLDSTLHMYIEPVLWNENNQIKSEIIDIYSVNQQLNKAIFTGDPIMSSEVDSEHYNQVKGKVMEAFFRANEIYKLDVNGNGQTYYYMTEDSTQNIQGFLIAECADITFRMANRQIEQIIYRGDPVYTIYPMNKIPADQELLLPGFVWEIDRKPTLEQVFNRTIRDSEREIYEALELPIFPMTDAIMTNKARLIKDGYWRERNDKISADAMEFVNSLGH